MKLELSKLNEKYIKENHKDSQTTQQVVNNGQNMVNVHNSKMTPYVKSFVGTNLFLYRATQFFVLKTIRIQ